MKKMGSGISAWQISRFPSFFRFYFGLEGKGRVVREEDAAATASRKVFRNAVIR
uniref:hypothetical protein n=1 Tax=Eubacterium sp. TaxID=142586 RepID=UPI004027CCEE